MIGLLILGCGDLAADPPGGRACLAGVFPAIQLEIWAAITAQRCCAAGIG